MRLNLKALALALGLAWGGGVLVVGLAHLIWPGYGSAFLALIASVYPGYRVGGLGEVIIGTLYGVLDGALCGVVVGWLYDAAAATATPRG